MCNTFYSRYL